MRAGLFPGQGVRTATVLEALGRAGDVLGEAGDILGYDLLRRVEVAGRGSRRGLPTAVAQPAIYVASVAAHRQAPWDFDVLAGHSLGEYAALTAAGAMSFADGLRCVAARGEAMSACCKAAGGGMAGVIGLSLDEVEELAAEAGVIVANDNAPDQVAVAGDDAGLERIAELARRAGARTVLLGVEGPMHSPVMADAATALAAVLDRIELHEPRPPVVSNVTARPYAGAAEIKDLLVAQVTARVRWRESIRWMWDQGVRDFVDLGPGKVVGPLAQRSIADKVGADAG